MWCLTCVHVWLLAVAGVVSAKRTVNPFLHFVDLRPKGGDPEKGDKTKLQIMCDKRCLDFSCVSCLLSPTHHRHHPSVFLSLVSCVLILNATSPFNPSSTMLAVCLCLPAV